MKAAREDLAKDKKRPRRLAQGATSNSLTEEGALETPRPTPASGAATLASLIAVREEATDLTDDEIYAQAEKEAEAERQQDASARAILIRACNADIGLNIIDKTTAKEQLDFLKQLYAPLGRQQLSAKLAAFQAYAPKSSSNIIDIYCELNLL